MNGLLISQPHITEIVEGRRLWDRRPFYTRKRGKVALVDSTEGCVRGYAVIKGVRKIPYSEYQDQYGKRITGDMWATYRDYYEIQFSDVEKLPEPLPVDIGECTVWIELPDHLGKKSQKSLFDF